VDGMDVVDNSLSFAVTSWSAVVVDSSTCILLVQVHVAGSHQQLNLTEHSEGKLTITVCTMTASAKLFQRVHSPLGQLYFVVVETKTTDDQQWRILRLEYMSIRSRLRHHFSH
jgi:hypothetical protein